MAGEKSFGKLLGYWIFYVIGWRRFVSFVLAFLCGMLLAAGVMSAALAIFPRPDFPTGDPILNDKYSAPQRWESSEPNYVAHRKQAEDAYAIELSQYDILKNRRENALNLAGGCAILAGVLVGVIAYRHVRHQVWPESGAPS